MREQEHIVRKTMEAADFESKGDACYGIAGEHV